MKLIKKQVDIDGVSVEYHCPAYFTVDESGALIHVYHWQTLHDYQGNQTPVRTTSASLPADTDLSGLVEALVGHEGGLLYGGEVVTLPDGPEVVQQAKDRTWELIKREREQREYGGFEWDGSRFDSDAESQRRIQGAAQLAMLAVGAGQPFSIDWTLEDNTVRTLSAADMIAVGAALGQYVSALYDVSRTLRAAVQAAQTLEELNAIGWPS